MAMRWSLTQNRHRRLIARWTDLILFLAALELARQNDIRIYTKPYQFAWELIIMEVEQLQ